MKKRVLIATVFCVFACAFIAGAAEKGNIIVKTYTNVLDDASNGYAVNSTGDLVTYAFSTNAGGELSRFTFTFTRKSGNAYNGEIDPTYFPTDAADATIVGVERNIALILFNTLAGDRVYMVFRLHKNNTYPTPNKNNFTQKTVADTEECSLTKK